MHMEHLLRGIPSHIARPHPASLASPLTSIIPYWPDHAKEDGNYRGRFQRPLTFRGDRSFSSVFGHALMWAFMSMKAASLVPTVPYTGALESVLGGAIPSSPPPCTRSRPSWVPCVDSTANSKMLGLRRNFRAQAGLADFLSPVIRILCRPVSLACSAHAKSRHH